jgi:D-alanyl-D-alanine carboxypeptidase/D-alanyl-D-alanine-endopeptidase (penicillin-binding protein 4)
VQLFSSKTIVFSRFTLALSLCSLSLAIALNACTGNNPTANNPTTETTPTQTDSNSPKAQVSAASVNPPEPKPLLVAPDNPDPKIQAQIEQYLDRLEAQGFPKTNQGIWLQVDGKLLANHQGTVPLPAASVTKIATSLVALQNFGPDRQFETVISATGPIENGVLQGDLVIEGGQDPFFVWEEAIALGNTLKQLGIDRVAGNLAIVGPFYMNFETDPITSGNFLKQGLNRQLWSAEVENQYATLPPETPRPEVAISGDVLPLSAAPQTREILVRHYSFPVAELLKKMNLYSNNLMADMFAEAVGGADIVARKAAETVGVPPTEIQLINGSGLGAENRISPRAATGLFLAISRELEPYNLTLSDVVAIAGRDTGILEDRPLPPLAVVKSGSLNDVSTIAGVLPTEQQGDLWFAIMNGGYNFEGFRQSQEQLLNSFVTQWGAVSTLPSKLQPSPSRQTKGSRSQIVK